MRKIEAKIIWFEARNVNKETNIPRSYYFNASDWLETYSSEEFRANVVWWCWDITETLKMMQIPYNPEKKEDTIKAQNDRLNQIEMELQQHSWVKKLLLKVAYSTTQILKWAYSATQTAKERLESWENPYMEFKWHKLSVGDQVSVYIDPDDPTNYRIDTDFLYI